jgi:hypothetical protein
MDSFEQIVSEILWRKGYWVHTRVKVELTKEEKKAIGIPTSPRWELDIVAYNGRDNLLRVVECKSFLDSNGVALRAFNGNDERFAKRFKLFNDERLRKVVFSCLCRQFTKSGLCRSRPAIKLCLVCGKITSEADRKGLRKLFAPKRWELWDESWLCERLKEMAKGGYEDQVSAVVAKLLVKHFGAKPRAI